ncbi:MAG: hypothetical protein JSR98_10620 [Proteobacteria bacterium]|nr:hypothetical protein [Pseudomonadota bacterium]
MNWLDRWTMNRAAGVYARVLSRELRRGWGGSDHYTPDQVRAAIRRLGFKGRYICVGYAAFLTEPDYLSVASELPYVLPYDRARQVYLRNKPDGDAFSEVRDAEMTSAGDTIGGIWRWRA